MQRFLVDFFAIFEILLIRTWKQYKFGIRKVDCDTAVALLVCPDILIFSFHHWVNDTLSLCPCANMFVETKAFSLWLSFNNILVIFKKGKTKNACIHKNECLYSSWETQICICNIIKYYFL